MKTPPNRPPPTGSKGRDYVSPLGGQCFPLANNLQLTQERRNRAQTLQSQSGAPERSGNRRPEPRR
jgi:hypothetical protein